MRSLYLLTDMNLIDSEITVSFESISHSDFLTFTLPVVHLHRCILDAEPTNACHYVDLMIHGVLFYVPLPTYYQLRVQFDKLTK